PVSDVHHAMFLKELAGMVAKTGEQRGEFTFGRGVDAEFEHARIGSGGGGEAGGHDRGDGSEQEDEFLHGEGWRKDEAAWRRMRRAARLAAALRSRAEPSNQANQAGAQAPTPTTSSASTSSEGSSSSGAKRSEEKPS